ncbi:MAG: transporter substrate-binding domain-containing protein [SAR324 cluster bacterium]|nr:transporter substrate-binding domain-containing protein [SAR324 cluster bacterium]
MKKFFLFLLCLFSLGPLLTAAQDGDGIQKVSLQLNWKHQFQFAGYYVAQEKGFYQNAGLEVEIREFELGTKVADEILSRKADFGVGRSSLIIDKMKGKDVLLLAAIFQHSPFVLLTKKRSDLEKVTDFKNKKIMVSDDVIGMAGLTAMLKVNGVLAENFTAQDHSFNVEDLISGKTDAMAAYTSNEPFVMEQNGVPYSIFAPQEHGFDFYSDLLFTSQSLFQDNPQIVEKFYQTSLQGWEYAFAHMDETAEIILQNYNSQKKSKEFLLFEGKTLKELAYDPDTPLGSIDQARISQIAQVYLLLGLASQSASLDDLLFQPKQYPDLGLTIEELLFLSEHSSIRVHNEQGWPPYNFYELGRPRGYSVDYIRLLAKKVGLQVEFVSGPSWGEFIDQVKDKNLDVMLNIAKSPEREKFLNFSNSYLDLAQALYTRKDMEPVHSIKDLFGKRFAIPQGFYFEEKLKEFPEVTQVSVKDTAESLQAVAFGQADAMLDLIPVVQYYQKKLAIDNVVLGGSLGMDEGKAIPLHIGVRKDWPELPAIFNKVMNTLADEELLLIENKWLKSSQINRKGPDLKLTKEEQTWLKANRLIKVHNEWNWPPFNFNRGGIPSGFSIDYMNLLAERIGIEVEYVTGEWGELLDLAFEKKIDVMLNIVNTPERRQHLLYTDAYAKNPNVIITKQGSLLSDTNSLSGKKVAYPEGFFYDELLKNKFPDIVRVPLKNTLNTLEALQYGKVDAVLAELAVANHLIRENLLTGLVVQGGFDSGNPEIELLNLAVRNDWPELQSILSKAMASISQIEYKDLQERWLGIQEVTISADSSANLSPTESLETLTKNTLIQGMLFALIVIFVLGTLYFLSQRYYANVFSKILQSDKIGWAGPTMIVIFLIFIVLIAEVALTTLEKQTRSSIADSLRSVTRSSNEALLVWIGTQVEQIRQLSRDPELLSLTEEHLLQPNEQESLIRAGSLKNIRQYFDKKRDSHGNIGFFIISPDNINIGSMRDSNLGKTNLIAKQRPEFLQKAFQGDVVFVPPVQSDVPLEPESEESISNEPTMFFAAPIKDQSGKVIAVLTLRLDPGKDFSRLTQNGKIGETGETYAFDKAGYFISRSRFGDQLQNLGLIRPNQQEVLNLRISDPGAKLTQGFQSRQTSSERPLTRSVQSAISGQSGFDTEGYRDYRGMRVLGSWVWNEELAFGLATEIDENEAMATFHTTRVIVVSGLAITSFLAIVLTLISLWFGKRANIILTKSRDELEDQVEERTRALVLEVEERKKSQEALLESEQKFRNLVEGFKEGYFFFSHDPQGFMQYVTPSVTDILGYSQEEFLVNFREFLTDNPVNKKVEYFLEVTLQGIAQPSFQVEVRRKNGDSCWLEISEVPTKDQSGNVIGVEGIANDITERKHAEMRFIGIVESAPDGMVIVDENRIITQVNQKTEQIFGYNRDELIDQKIEILIPSRFSGDHPAKVEKYMASPDSRAMGSGLELYAVRKNGEEFPTEVSLSPLKTKDGFIVSAVIRDITDRKRIEDEIKESRKQLELALEGGNLGLWDWNPISGELTTNELWASMLGYAPDELGKRTEKWSNLMHPDDEESTFRLLRQHLEGKTDVYRSEHRLKTKGGDWKWILDIGKATDRNEKGEATRLIGVHIDIDEMKKMQSELENARELAEQATRAKSEFLANMSHEIRTPMNAIIGMSHLALQTELNRKQKNYIEKVHRSGQSLLGIINDILDFSKIEAGKMDMEETEFRLEDVMDNLANLVGLKAEDKSLELLFDISPDVPMALVGDPLRLGQVLINLGNNAVKFTETGEIVVTVRVKSLDEGATTLHFAVKDSGIGMTPEQQSKLFQSFSQADSSTTRKYGGTGLGLTISKRITEMMGGEIWVESAAGKGSTFQFTADFVLQADQTTGPVRVKLPELQGIRVLVVDDNATAREILTGMLSSFDFAVTAVTSGQGALDLIAESDSKFDLVMMDLQMPQLDGIETTRLLQKNPLAPPVIMVTAYGHEVVLRSTDEVTFSSIVSKPVSPSALLNATMEAFGHQIEPRDRSKRYSDDLTEILKEIKGARILLVEDNEINQELALELLSSNGLIPSLAENGQIALEILKTERFDGVLMDCQMPVMDGYTASRKIREQKQFKDLPVIAMTANVMSGDREKVLAAGMNDHIGKPIDVNEMFSTMAKWITPAEPLQENGTGHDLVTEENSSSSADELPELPGIDVAKGLAITQGNQKLYRRLLIKFRDNQRDFESHFLRLAFNEEYSDEDPEAATRSAHTLKGVAGNIGAHGVQQAAKELESACKDGKEPEQIRSLLDQVQKELNSVMPGLELLDQSQIEADESSAADPAALNTLLLELKELLEDDDTEAVAVLEKLKGQVKNVELGKILNQLEECVAQYDFEEALEQFELIYEKLSIALQK